MIEVHVYEPSTGSTHAGGVELLAAWKNSAQMLIWVNLPEHVSVAEIEPFADLFHLHPLAVQDAFRERHPPKLESFDESTFILLKGLSAEVDELEYSTIQLAIFIGQRFLLTRHSGPSVSVAKLRQDLGENPLLWQTGVEGLMLRLCKTLVGRYLKVLLSLEPRLEQLEEEIFDDADDTILAELIKHKGDLKKLRRVFLYHQQLFAQLRDDHSAGVFEHHIHEINDVFEQQERANSLAGLYYELASDLVEGYISVSSHHLNQIMKVLTIVSAIFIPLTFLAGIYGMNFDNMPELHSQAGYFVLLAIMAVTAIALLIFFRRKKWL
jgi:magnesium transporter